MPAPVPEVRYKRTLRLSGATLGSAIHTSFKVLAYLSMICLVVTVGAVLLVVVGPILLDINILAEPTYTRVEDFLRRMLLYVVVFAVAYTASSWLCRLTMSEPEPST